MTCEVRYCFNPNAGYDSMTWLLMESGTVLVAMLPEGRGRVAVNRTAGYEPDLIEKWEVVYGHNGRHSPPLPLQPGCHPSEPVWMLPDGGAFMVQHDAWGYQRGVWHNQGRTAMMAERP